MANFTPWEKYHALTLDRLIITAGIIRGGRHLAVLDHQPSKGDDAWTLGCLAYRRTCYAIAQAGQEHPWLTVLLEEQNRFTFAIESIPLKQYHGLAGDPPSRSLAVSFAELCSIQLCLDDGALPDKNHLLRIAVETDATGEAKNVILVELDENGNVTGTFTIPERGAFIRPMTPSPVDPGPPSFMPRQEEEKKQDRRERRTGTEGNGR
jgi:hypothetical protein